MQEVQTILIVLLSIGFFILLILGIAIVLVMFKIMTNIRRITQRLDETTENLGDMATYVGKSVAPKAVSVLGSLLWRGVRSRAKKKDK